MCDDSCCGSVYFGISTFPIESISHIPRSCISLLSPAIFHPLTSCPQVLTLVRLHLSLPVSYSHLTCYSFNNHPLSSLYIHQPLSHCSLPDCLSCLFCHILLVLLPVYCLPTVFSLREAVKGLWVSRILLHAICSGDVCSWCSECAIWLLHCTRQWWMLWGWTPWWQQRTGSAAKILLQVRLELATSASRCAILSYKYYMLTNCTTGTWATTWESCSTKINL